MREKTEWTAKGTNRWPAVLSLDILITMYFNQDRLSLIDPNTVGTRFNDLEGTGEFWSLNPSVVKSNL